MMARRIPAFLALQAGLIWRLSGSELTLMTEFLSYQVS
jgi:hypothetical protein